MDTVWQPGAVRDEHYAIMRLGSYQGYADSKG